MISYCPSCYALAALCTCGYKRTTSLSQPEPPPKDSEAPAIWDLVIEDMKARDAMGLAKYGTRLQANNGRKSLTDLYQELLDAVVYARQEIYEREGK